VGADIHLYLEYREKGGEWNLHPRHTEDKYEKDYINDIQAAGRWYKLFGILAEVRGDGCIYQPRGFPSDMSKRLKSHTDKFLEHTPHWLTIKEFKHCLDKVEKIWKKEIKQEYKHHQELLSDGNMTQQEFDRYWKDDPKEKKKPKWENIFNYGNDTYPNFYNHYEPPGYFDIIPYIEKLEDEMKAEYILIDQEPPEYEFRFVFYFDS